MNFKNWPGKELIKRTKVLNEEKPIISIISPFYNGQKELEETYNSIINQTYPYFEWIIVNDGSTNEESNKIVESISKKDKRIKYFKIENSGPAVARDYGISKAAKSTKYV